MRPDHLEHWWQVYRLWLRLWQLWLGVFRKLAANCPCLLSARFFIRLCPGFVKCCHFSGTTSVLAARDLCIVCSSIFCPGVLQRISACDLFRGTILLQACYLCLFRSGTFCSSILECIPASDIAGSTILLSACDQRACWLFASRIWLKHRAELKAKGHEHCSQHCPQHRSDYHERTGSKLLSASFELEARSLRHSPCRLWLC